MASHLPLTARDDAAPSGAPPSARQGTDERRLTGLDGLRGLAAAVVLVHHSLLLTPALLHPYRDPRATDIGTLTWWATHTPFHLLWDGAVAVHVFFVLSGFVLTLPAIRGRGTQWVSYYPQRLVRLYLPVWAAIALALAWHHLSPAPAPAGALSDWVTTRAPNISTYSILHDAALVVGRPGATNSALWSLRWEVVFSLLLPLFVMFAVRARRLVVLKVALLLAMMLLGAALGPAAQAYQLGALYQLPLFAAGCLMAVEKDRLLRWAARMTRSSEVLLVGLAVVLLASYWLIYAGGSGSPVMDRAAVASRALQGVGAAIVVFIALTRPHGLLGWRAVQWLGSRSFSLYLVHEPVIVAVAHTTGLHSPVALAITVPASLLLTEAFFRIVERPSHQLARYAGRSSVWLASRRGTQAPRITRTLEPTLSPSLGRVPEGTASA